MSTSSEIHRIPPVVPLYCFWWAIVRMNHRLRCRLTSKISGFLGDICIKHKQDQDGHESKCHKEQHIGVIHLHCEEHKKDQDSDVVLRLLAVFTDHKSKFCPFLLDKSFLPPATSVCLLSSAVFKSRSTAKYFLLMIRNSI